MLVFVSVMVILLLIGVMDAFGVGKLLALLLFVVLGPIMLVIERCTHYLWRFWKWLTYQG